MLEEARKVFYVTPNLEPFIQRFGPKLRYLPNPIDVDAVPPNPRVPDQVRSVLIFMRLDPVKGVRFVFPAVPELANTVELTAMAWGPLTNELTRRYGDLVRFVPPAAHDEVGPFLQQFELVIGQMEQGALGLSELEAMAAGRPLISGIDRDLYPGDKPPVVSSYSADELIAQVDGSRTTRNGSRTSPARAAHGCGATTGSSATSSSWSRPTSALRCAYPRCRSRRRRAPRRGSRPRRGCRGRPAPRVAAGTLASRDP